MDFLHEKGYLQVEHKETNIDEAGRSLGLEAKGSGKLWEGDWLVDCRAGLPDAAGFRAGAFQPQLCRAATCDSPCLVEGFSFLSC